MDASALASPGRPLPGPPRPRALQLPSAPYFPAPINSWEACSYFSAPTNSWTLPTSLPAHSAPPPSPPTFPPLLASGQPSLPAPRSPAFNILQPRPCSPLALSSHQAPPQRPPPTKAPLPSLAPAPYLKASNRSSCVLAPPPGRSSLPCSGDSRARRCTWRRESGCISCSSCHLRGCTPEGRGRRGGRRASPNPPTRTLPRAHPRIRVSHLAPAPPLTCTEPQSHSSPASTKPFPHSGGSRSWTGRTGRESDPDPAQAPLPCSPPRGWYLEGLVEEAAPTTLLQKLVVLVDAAARELAGQVEPG